jgi:SAM-dependent methyltransferase
MNADVHEAGEDWEFRNADTQYLTHNIHRYSGKFIPQIARRVIEMTTAPGDLIVDPYCGSGTTILEAILLGRRAIGIDLSPLAVEISKAKTTQIDPRQARCVLQELSEALTARHDGSQSLFGASGALEVHQDARSSDPWFTKWFQRPVLEDLIAIDLSVRSISDTSIRRLGRVALSDVLRRHSNAHSGYPNVMFDKSAPPKPSPIPRFLKRFREIVDACIHLSTSEISHNFSTIIRGDASRLPLGTNTATAFVTHPPYIGSIPYAEYGSLSLKWLGHEPKELDKKLTGGKRQSKDVVDRFAVGYRSMISEASRVLKPGGILFTLTGDPTVKGAMVDLAEMTREYAAESGLVVFESNTRAGVNRRANKMKHETLLWFRKQS